MKKGIVTTLVKLTILAGLILNPLAAFAADKNGVSKDGISLSEWKKYSPLTSPSRQIRAETGFIDPINFDGGNFDYFNAANTGGFSALNEISTSYIFAIGALVVGGIVIHKKIIEDKNKPSTASTSPPPPTPPADGESCNAGGGANTGTIVSGSCQPRSGQCNAGGGANTGTYNGAGVCIANSGSCNAGGGANTGIYNGAGVCIANSGSCNAGGGANTGIYNGAGVCIANSGSCNAGGGANTGTYNGAGVCIVNSGSCNAGGGANTGTYDSSGICEARTGACDISGGTNNGMFDGSGVCMINTGACDSGSGAGSGTYDSSGMCAPSCESDTTHADRRMVFMRGLSGASVSMDTINAPVRDYSRSGEDVYFIRSGAMIRARFARSAEFTENGVTYRGRLEQDSTTTFGTPIHSQLGDRVAFVASGVTPNDADFTYRIYLVRNDPTQGNQNIAYFAQEGGTNPTVCSSSTTLETGEFYLDDDYALTGDYSLSRTTFSLQEGFRGFLNENNAIRIGNFYFANSAEFSNYHLEYRTDFWSGESFNIHVDNGFKQQDNGKTSLYYSKATAIKSLSEKASVYMQLSAGEIASEIYRNSRLQGVGLGMFANSVFRHDDAYHVRLSQPFSAAKVREWQLSADAIIGEEKHYVRFGVLQKLGDSAKTQANVFYTREF